MPTLNVKTPPCRPFPIPDPAPGSAFHARPMASFSASVYCWRLGFFLASWCRLTMRRRSSGRATSSPRASSEMHIRSPVGLPLPVASATSSTPRRSQRPNVRHDSPARSDRRFVIAVGPPSVCMVPRRAVPRHPGHRLPDGRHRLRGVRDRPTGHVRRGGLIRGRDDRPGPARVECRGTSGATRSPRPGCCTIGSRRRVPRVPGLVRGEDQRRPPVLQQLDRVHSQPAVRRHGRPACLSPPQPRGGGTDRSGRRPESRS